MESGSMGFYLKVRLLLYLKVLWILLLILTYLKASKAQECELDHTVMVQPGGVCGNLDIRNDIRNLQKLENCTVIEGYLRIALIERVKDEEYEPYRFPKLREITDHLVLYRVYGLNSLRDMFPNLAVIRGRVLFTNYALVAYEMIDLEELGLVNLQVIGRGGVHLAKNKKLCYVDTVDWARLGVEPDEQHFKYNREESQCANYCPEKCNSTTVDGIKAKRCWTSQHCQKNLNCRDCEINQTCMESGKCCHKYCLGGCTGTSPNQCFSCRDVVYQGMCQLKCPDDTYMYFQRRCLEAKQCSELNLFNTSKKPEPHTRLVLYKGEANNEPNECLSACPANYMVEWQKNADFEFSQCVRCKGPCPKECIADHINSIQVLQALTGCSKINGDLVIEILGGSNVAEEMEKGLGKIKEITGWLDIHKSFPLLNLFFLKSLEIIRGENHDKSFLLYDNKNLQELFPEEQMKKMTLKKSADFKDNPKLCPSKILQFKTFLNLSDAMIKDHNNGNLMPCADKHLNLTITKIEHDHAKLEFEQVSEGDSRRVLSYIINYKEIKDKYVDVNIYQGRDACSEDVWMTIEISANEDATKNVHAEIGELKPFTNYAVYVQAYTLSTASHSAMTQVKTFTTNPFNPSKPRNVEVIANGPHELRVKWTEPKKPNGIIDHYVVSYEKEELIKSEFDKRDYCKHPVVTSKKKKKEEVNEKEKYLNTSSQCCACPKSKSELEAEAKEQEMDIFFEDYLHGSVYCKRFQELPFKLDENIRIMSLSDLSNTNLDDYLSEANRSSSNMQGQKKHRMSKDDNIKNPNMTNARSDYEFGSRNKTNMDGPQQEIVNGTELVLNNLEHFREYSIMVKACHERNPVTGKKLCSARAITQGRTEALSTFDAINMSSIKEAHVVNKSSDYKIKWDLPANPNGLTVMFKLFYKQANQDNLVPREVCVSMQEYYKNERGYLISGLVPGNWTYQIRPVSLGGDGILTDKRYFFIPLPPGNNELQTGTVIAIVGAALVIIVVVIISYCCVKHRFRKEDMTVISQNINYIPSEPAYVMDGWEVDRSKIRTIREIGQGSFGMVYEGIATGLGDDPNEEIKVAVKTVNDRAGFNDRREFLKEATTMKAFDCFHVVKLLGVVSTGQPALVIMELMALGDLKNYLREHRPDEETPDVTPPSLQDILQMAGEVADGMAYLADKKFVHRDLAARNCMVAEDKTVKIGDFGMTRDVYETDYYRKGGKGMLPVRWMAPESLKDGMFSSMSDVWSYGVVIWEMVTLATQPYQGLSNDQVIKFIIDGSTMDMPERCPEEMAYLMRRCWAKRIKNRPTFKEIIAYLLPHLNARFEKVSYYFSEGGGHSSDAGRTLGEHEEGGSVGEEDDDCSMNSLSCEGAAAPRQSLRVASDYGYGSPTASADSASVYDEGIDSVTYVDDNEQPQRGGYFSHPGNGYGNNDHSDFGEKASDLEQSFICDGFQDVPCVMVRQPNGPSSSLYNSGLIELQPLLGSGRAGGAQPSSRSNNVQTSFHPSFSPGFVDHRHNHHPQQCSPNTETPVSQQTLQNCSPFSLAAADPLRAGPPGQPSAPVLDHLRSGATNLSSLGPCSPLEPGPPVSHYQESLASGIIPSGSLPTQAKSLPLPTTSG
ncbi:tyrosine-protein kinase receptor [Plakobranchus ocellatus]|uniref:Tyrosine-protein kinase receptor n=1 Tax=Plakobranchus ocellatus TaxID=259542 RepID=A0AAV4DAB8_9GAST|nr:tyrosine-protein kinase receptor [Plakobranchus ocellatus]